MVRGTDPFDLSEFDRASVIPIQGTGEAPALVRVKTVEDTILRKLQWYRLGGKQSDRQWTDILGCLRGQTATIDHDYLGRWARDLGVDDLLDRAYAEA